MGERVHCEPVELVEGVLATQRPKVDALPDVRQVGQVVGPTPVEVVQHDVAADPFEMFLGVLAECLLQFGVSVRREFGQLLARGGSAQQRVAAFDDDRALLSDELVVAPRVGVHVQQPALGDSLGVIEQSVGLGAGDAPGLVALGRELGVLEVGDDDVVLPAGEEHRRTGVALPAGAAAQLVVQALGDVPTGTDDVQATEVGDLLLLRRVVGGLGAAEPDVGAAAGHLGRHRHGAELAGFGDDAGLLLIVFGVEHHRWNTTAHQTLVQVFGFGDVLGADQDRLTGAVHLDDVVDDGFVLGPGGDEDPVGFIVAHGGGVRGDRRDAKGVELPQLFTGSQGGPRHPADRGVPVDQRLNGDGVEHLTGLGGLDALFDLDGGLQTVGPALQRGDPAAGGVDELYGSVADDVMHIALQQRMGVQCDVDLGQGGGDVLLGVEVDSA